MAKRDVHRRVNQALRALAATKEDAVRDLAQAIDDIETLDAKIAELNTERTGLLVHAETRHTAAREVGWKTRELTDAALAVPRIPAPRAPSPTPTPAPSATPSLNPNPEDPRRLAG